MTTWHERLRGFYSILDRDDEQLARLLVRPIDAGGAGACALQLRLKPRQGAIAKATWLAVGRMARAVTAEAGALLVIDDHLDLALALDADGVHLGQADLPLAEARALVRRWRPARPFCVGISTHEPDQVAAALAGGADYLGFGPVFETETKEDPDPVQGLAGLAQAVAQAQATPVVAIGGITPARAAAVAETGAAAACCVRAVNEAASPVAAGAAIAAAWARPGS